MIQVLFSHKGTCLYQIIMILNLRMSISFDKQPSSQKGLKSNFSYGKILPESLRAIFDFFLKQFIRQIYIIEGSLKWQSSEFIAHCDLFGRATLPSSSSLFSRASFWNLSTTNIAMTYVEQPWLAHTKSLRPKEYLSESLQDQQKIKIRKHPQGLGIVYSKCSKYPVRRCSGTKAHSKTTCRRDWSTRVLIIS